MGRRKADPVFPARPVALIDALLEAEPDIRRTVRQERAALSLIGASVPSGGGGRAGLSDRTAKTAIKLADGLNCIVLDDGRTLHKPEKWLSVFDAVRDKAKKCNRPDWIFEEWAAWYGGEITFISSDITLENVDDIKNWIRYHALTEARNAGLVDFTDEEIIADVEATRRSWTK